MTAGRFAWVVPLASASDTALVGGKAVNLGAMMRAGLPVPPGFVVTTQAYRLGLQGCGGESATSLPPGVDHAIRQAYRTLCDDVERQVAVAVRSSATAEDRAAASMAGQYETFLDVRGEQAVADAVLRCWQSAAAARVQAYLTRHDIDPTTVGMAVVVQQLVDADKSGVLFTANPQTGAMDQMLIEASWGLGEMVVSGRVQPDTITLNFQTGEIVRCVIGTKQSRLMAGQSHEQPVPDDLASRCCLDSRELERLRALGVQAAAHFGREQDLEWAIAGRELFLLQSRAITAMDTARAVAEARDKAEQFVAEASAAGRGPWVMHNIGETLPHPTPLTWSVIRRFMSGRGGYGQLYRQVGFEPSDPVNRDGTLDLIGGRVYIDLLRAGGMFFEAFPFRYDLQEVATNPDAAMGPPTVPHGPMTLRLRAARRLAAVRRTLEQQAKDADHVFLERHVPDFQRWIETQRQIDLKRMDDESLIEHWHAVDHRVLDQFAPQSLLPSLVAAMAMEKLRGFLAEFVWDEDPEGLANELVVGAEPNQTLKSVAGLYDLAHGRMELGQWLSEHGHRASAEFELSSPRHHEQPAEVMKMAERLAAAESPLGGYERRRQAAGARLAEIAPKLSARQRRRLDEHLEQARRYLPLRENAKHELMRGYALLRQIALEFGRRLDIGDGVFMLDEDELFTALRQGLAPLHRIERRRLEHESNKRVALPRVITDAQSLRPYETRGERRHRLPGFVVSPGNAEGPARIVHRPEEADELGEGDILVCPSTDPSWTPLFARAAGVVLERGGTLSHGAVVAREMGKPAVVVDGATQLLGDGERVRIDGDAGSLIRVERDAADGGSCDDAANSDQPASPLPHAQAPPMPGRFERNAARIRNIAAVVWLVYLVTAFTLPAAWLWRPSMQAIDAVLLPAVKSIGPAGAVAMVALVLGVYSMVGQRWMTDNRRLLTAKRRAAVLRRQIAALPKNDPRRIERRRAAARVQLRLLGAAMVPLGLILGPMVMVFAWMPLRVDPASWNPRPGATALVSVSVLGDYGGPLTLTPPPGAELAPAMPKTQALTPIRPTLERLLARWRENRAISADAHWSVRAAAGQAREQMMASLADYLAGPLPPRNLAWTIRTPKEPGLYRATLAAEGQTIASVPLALGHGTPPPPKKDLGDGSGPVQYEAIGGDSPVQAIRVTYRQQRVRGQDVFLQPFAFAGWHWQAGWLMVYLVVYLFVMFILKLTLKVA